MKAAVYYENGAPQVFRYEDVADPVCDANGIVIDVKAVSIEGGDVLNRAGGALVTKPHVVGYQAGRRRARSRRERHHIQGRRSRRHGRARSAVTPRGAP